MTFGFATRVDALSWAVALALAIKACATLVLLRRDRASWFATGRSAALWWAAKIAPLLAVPCLIAIAVIQRRDGELWLYAALMLFVLVAVPVTIRQRHRR